MKKIISTLLSLCLSGYVYSAELDYGFGGILWGDNISGLQDLQLVRRYKNGVEAYRRDSEMLSLDGTQLDDVLYLFEDGIFFSVRLEHDAVVAMAISDALNPESGAVVVTALADDRTHLVMTNSRRMAARLATERLAVANGSTIKKVGDIGTNIDDGFDGTRWGQSAEELHGLTLVKTYRNGVVAYRKDSDETDTLYMFMDGILFAVQADGQIAQQLNTDSADNDVNDVQAMKLSDGSAMLLTDGKKMAAKLADERIAMLALAKQEDDEEGDLQPVSSKQDLASGDIGKGDRGGWEDIDLMSIDVDKIDLDRLLKELNADMNANVDIDKLTINPEVSKKQQQVAPISKLTSVTATASPSIAIASGGYMLDVVINGERTQMLAGSELHIAVGSNFKIGSVMLNGRTTNFTANLKGWVPTGVHNRGDDRGQDIRISPSAMLTRYAADANNRKYPITAKVDGADKVIAYIVID
ncbi:hypothetical protein RsTz2092_10190 [Deferribacterales bacterium RsTz2092]|nr:hypothetical protein AGMMS49941_08220 [Deferribacterales bacterium]